MRMVAGTMAAGEGVGLVLALLVPLAIRSVLNALHGRDARRRTSKAEEKATAAAQEALPTEAVLRRQRKVAAAANSKISMLALKEASTTHFGSHFGGKALIEAALEESADRYKVARHILRRDHRHQRAEAALQQAFGSTMDKSDEGLEAAFAKVDEDSSGQISDAEMRGYIVSMFDGTIDEETITQMLKAADADGDGEVSLDEFKTIMRAGPDVKEEGGGGTLSEQLERNRAQEDAALAALAVDEQVKAEEVDALRDVPQRSMRHRAVDSIMARKQMSKRDVAREKAEHLAELSGRSTETARAIVEAQAAAQLTLIAADDPDEIEMCQLEEGAKTKSAEELHAKLAALGVEVSHKIADDLEALIELLVRTRHAKLVAKARKRAARRALAKQGSLPPVPEGACKGRLRVYLVSATGLIAADAGGKSDPYVRLRVGACSEKSEVIKNTLEPVWEQKIEFTGELTEFFDTGLLLEVFDWDRFSGDDSLGSVQISLEEELRPDRILEDGAGWPIEEDLSLKGSIRLRVAWRPENEVLVTSVDKRGAAHGLLLRGDTIVAINYTRVTDEAQARALGGAAVGEVTYSVLRLNAEANRHELHLLTVEKPEVAVPLGIAMKDLSNKPEEPETPESWVKEQQVLFAMKVLKDAEAKREAEEDRAEWVAEKAEEAAAEAAAKEARAEARAIARLPGGPERPAPRDKLAAALDAAAVVEKKRLEAVEGPPGGPQEAARNWLRKASIAQVGPSELSGPLPPMAGPLLARLHMENEFFASPFRRAPSASGASSPKSPRSPRERAKSFLALRGPSGRQTPPPGLPSAITTYEGYSPKHGVYPPPKGFLESARAAAARAEMIDLSGPETLLAATAAVANRAIRRSSSGSVLPFDAPDESLRLPQSLAAASRDSSSRASPTPCCALVTKPLVTNLADSVPSGSYASASAYTRKLSLTLPYRSEMSSPKGRRPSQLSGRAQVRPQLEGEGSPLQPQDIWLDEVEHEVKTWEQKVEARNLKQRKKQAQLRLQTEEMRRRCGGDAETEMQMQRETEAALAKPLPYVRTLTDEIQDPSAPRRSIQSPPTSLLAGTPRRRASEPLRLTTHAVEKIGSAYPMVKVGNAGNGGQRDEWEDVSVSDASDTWRERVQLQRSQGARDPKTLQRSQSARAVAKPTNRRHWSYARTLADARETLDVGSDVSFEELTAALEAGLSEVLQSNQQEGAKAAKLHKLKDAYGVLVNATRASLAA